MKNTVELLAVKTNGLEMLDAVSQPLNQFHLVELAGRTCYKSQNKMTHDSAKRFIGALIKSGHEAMIEFSWLTFVLPKKHLPNVMRWLVEVLKSGAHVIVTEREEAFILSGNFRSFRDLFRYVPLYWEFTASSHYTEGEAIYLFLAKHYPEVTEGLVEIGQEPYANEDELDYWFKRCSEDGFYGFSGVPLTDQEKIKHYFAAARFVGSRAFTHQGVRHRKSSFAQESQRYCDESGFMDNEYFIVPPSIEEAGLKDFYLAELAEINLMHEKLLKLLEGSGLKGKKLKEDARFLLPNAVKSEICMAGNLEQWFRVFKLRLDPHAQWEIRGVMEEFQKQLYAAIPEVERLYSVFLKNSEQ